MLELVKIVQRLLLEVISNNQNDECTLNVLKVYNVGACLLFQCTTAENHALFI